MAPAATGETLVATGLDRDLPPGDTLVEADTKVEKPHLWDLEDPFLYQVTVRLDAEQADSSDEASVRCGFRDFRVVNGYFRLNGKRILVRSAHTGNH